MTRGNVLGFQQKSCRSLYYLFNSFCLYLILSRAFSLPIQGDEAGTYLRHASQGVEGLFNLATANNHFLNTLLIVITTSNAAFSEVAIRLPTIGIYSWFYFHYIPNRLYDDNWSDKLLFAGLSLLPYYINEYASMARGYVMAGCFACAALNESALYPLHGSDVTSSMTRARSGATETEQLSRTALFSSLAVLASIVILPLFLLIQTQGVIRWLALRREGARIGQALPLAGAARLSSGALVLSLHTFVAIKASGVSTIVSSPLPFGTWIVKAPSLLWLPVASITNTEGSASGLFTLLITGFLATAMLLAALHQGRHQNLRWAVLLLGLTLALIYVLALAGSYPIGRGWVPYWFAVIFCVVAQLRFGPAIRAVMQHPSKGCLRMILPWLAAIVFAASWSLQRSFRTDYVYEFRPFFYQYKSLMHYSRTQNLQCLSYGDINDEVLKFYFLNPAGPVPRPQECPKGKASQYGFMPYSHNNKEPVFD